MRGLILAGFVSIAGMGCATTGATRVALADTPHVSIERVVFDNDEGTGPRTRVTGPSAVTVGWRIDVSGHDAAGKTTRSVEWVYEDVATDEAERDTTPPAEVTARAARLAARLTTPLTVAHR